jgi:[NiFe] hydrogenase large subunit
LFFPQGVILGGDQVKNVDLSKIAEHVSHSWYNGSKARHPSAGETLPNYTALITSDRYSWLKAPRYRGEPVEVGPLARVLVGYGRGEPVFENTVNGFLSRAGLPVEALLSTLGRTAARLIDRVLAELDRLGATDKRGTSGNVSCNPVQNNLS